LEHSVKIAKDTAVQAGDALKNAAQVTVTNPATGTVVKGATTATVTKVLGASILGAVAVAGVQLAGEAYIDWLISQGNAQNMGLSKSSDGYVMINRVGEGIDPTFLQHLRTFLGSDEKFQHYYGKCLDPRCDSQPMPWSCSSPQYPSQDWMTAQGGAIGIVDNIQTYQCMARCMNWSTLYYQRMEGEDIFCSNTEPPMIPTSEIVKATEAELIPAINAGYANDLSGAITHLQRQIGKLSDAIDKYSEVKTTGNTGDPWLDDPNGTLADVLSHYYDALNETDMTDMQNQAGTGTGDDVQDATDQINEANTITKDDIKNAVKKAIDEANSQAASETLTPLTGLTQPDAPPAKGTIAPLIDTFMEGIGQLPIISFFTSMKNLSMSGSCEVVLSMPNPFTNSVNQVTVSMCPFESTFMFMGSCLLTIVGVRWMFYLFEG
jgi:hypothetical protein